MEYITSFVVEDIHESLEMLCADIERYHSEIKVTGKATSVVAAAKLLQKEQPDILFLDIMLGDGTGFDLLEIHPNLKSKVVFITASDEFAVKAFKYAAIDYILKPYSIEELTEAIERAKVQISPIKPRLDIVNQSLNSINNVPNRISLHTSEKIIIVEIKTIIRCQSDNNYTTFYMLDGTSILVSRTLKYYSELLIDAGFIRTHQSHLVNKKFIKEYIKSDGGYLLLTNGTNIPISVRKKVEILKIIKKN